MDTDNPLFAKRTTGDGLGKSSIFLTNTSFLRFFDIQPVVGEEARPEYHQGGWNDPEGEDHTIDRN